MSDYSVFIGDVALDEFFRASQWPAAPGTKIDLFPLTSTTGGMIANAAVVYAALGEDARFLWSMNDGSLTRSLLADLEENGVDTGLVTHDPALADSRNFIVLADGEHTVMTPALGLDQIWLDDAAMRALGSAQYVYTAIGDLRSLRHDGRGPAEVMAAVRAAGARIVLDLDVANVRPGDDELISQTDVLLFNRRGFDRYCAQRPAEQVLDLLLTAGTSTIVVTLGAHGARVVDAGHRLEIPGIAAEVVDVTGAGDTFGAAFIHALNLTCDLRAAASFANAAAARAVTGLGARAGAASHAQVVAFAQQHGAQLDEHLTDNSNGNPSRRGKHDVHTQ